MAGRLQQIKAAIVAVETTFAAEALAEGLGEVIVHATRPDPPDAPAVYNVLGDSPTELVSMGSVRDTIMLIPRLCVAIANNEDYEAQLDDLGDLFTDVLDRDLRVGLKDLTEDAIRTHRRERLLHFSDVPYLAHEFPIRCRMRVQPIGPNPPRI